MTQKAVARLGDSSDHGGVIISAGTKMKCDGIFAARVTDLHSCPIPGHGITAITTGSSKVKSEGQYVAVVGSSTGCGATITTGSPTTTAPFEGGGGGGGQFTLDSSTLDGAALLG
jgi:uncharacterized Zn-binding protein involved in type VI secretion